jgi:signal transduction histidine kinase
MLLHLIRAENHSLLVKMFSLALTIPEIVQWVQHAQHEIFIISAIVAGMIALIMLFPRFESVGVGRWTKYLGTAFLVISVQYWAISITRSFFPGWRSSQILNPLLTLCSGLTSILFFVTARSLLGYARLGRVLNIAIAFVAISSFCISFDQYVETEWFWLLRIPDAIISSFCLGAVGYAIAINISSRHQKSLAIFALCWAVIGALIRISYGLNPLLADLNLINQWLGTFDRLETLVALDSLAFACALALKFALFIPAFWLLNSTSRTSDQLKRILVQQSETRISYLSANGIVRAIAEATLADTVEIAIRMPGNVQQVALLRWPQQVENDRHDQLIPIEASSALEEVLLKGTVIKQNLPPSRTATILVPISHNGGVIGCLRVERTDNTRFNEVLTQQIKEIALLLGPSVQSFRELASLDQASYRFAKLAIDYEVRSSKDIVEVTANILHDILEPLVTGLWVDVGFQKQEALLGRRSVYLEAIQREINNFDIKSESMMITARDLSELDVYVTPLIAAIRQESQRLDRATIYIDTYEKSLSYCPLGKLLLAVPASSDTLNHPTLGAYHLHRKAICAIATDALLDSARSFLSAKLKEFSLKVSQENLTVMKWFKAVEKTALDSELLWAVATNPSLGEDESESFIGAEDRWIDIVRQLIPEHEEEFVRNSISCVPLVSPVGGTVHVICLRLGEARLWLGVARPGFGIELNFESPWNSFLAELSHLADTALTRILTTQKFRKIQIEASQNQALATVAVTTGTLIHQLVNMTRDQMSGAATLQAALQTGQISIKDERYLRLFDSMKASGQRMLELTGSLSNITRVDDRRPCKLLEAVQHARDLFSISLAHYDITVECLVDSNLTIDVPFYVAALAFANLISNAKDAIKLKSKSEGGEPCIRVTAEANEGVVVCSITDNGIGIPAKMRETIFDLGFTTKPQSGGWGLYLVKRSLQETGCDIKLAPSTPGITTFTLSFPCYQEC